MKLQSITMLALLCVSKTYGRNSSTLEYILQAIEYISGTQTGIISCIFYDLGRPPFDNMLNDLLRSPRLEHVVKYLVNGTFQDRLKELPLHPSMLVMRAGHELSEEVVRNMDAVLWLLDPLTKVLVLVNNSNMEFVDELCGEIKAWHFASVAYLDEGGRGVRLSNSAYFIDVPSLPHPKHLFSYMKRKLKRRNVTFFHDYYLRPTTHCYLWITEVARYLNTEAVQYRHNCEHFSESAHARCMFKQKEQLAKVDINLNSDGALIHFGSDFRGFNILYSNIPLVTRVLVPRDRQLHPAELMLMPFSWQLWIILLVILVSAEFCKHLVPNLLKNDPILFVVCGFERHNLHKAGHWERIILHSLVVLMFFASNAYETKIISLMINPPSDQRIKTLDDAAAAGIKFYGNLQDFPWQRNDSVVGKMLVDNEMTLFDAIPGVGMLVTQELAAISDAFAFDYERGQPWYVVLEQEFFITCELYKTAYRSPFRDVFGYVHQAMLEAGIWNLWKRQYNHLARKAILADRSRKDVESMIYLDFDDMQLAWIVLAIGFCASGVAFAGELVRKRFDCK